MMVIYLLDHGVPVKRPVALLVVETNFGNCVLKAGAEIVRDHSVDFIEDFGGGAGVAV
jgi:hypothetical protein